MSHHWKVLRQTATEFIDDGALRLSAALSYYAAFSLAPLLLIAISVAGWVFGDEAVRGQVDDHLRSSMGSAGAGAVQDMVAHARKPESNAIASIVGIIMLLFGAGGVFGQLQDALNTVWGVKRRAGRGLRGILKDRFLSFAMVLGTGFLLLTSMLLTAFLQGASKWVGSVLSLPPQVWAVITAVASFVIIAALFAAIFKVLPDARVAWRHVWVGAVFTAVLFTIGKFVMGWYLGREATESAYGSAGALALVLLWVYYSSLILLFGAEFTQVSANSRGAAILPDEDAVAVDAPDEKSVSPEVTPVAPVEHPALEAPVVAATPPVGNKRESALLLGLTVLPAVAGWALAPAAKKGATRLARKSAFLRDTGVAIEHFGARHSPPWKLILLSAACVVWQRRKHSKAKRAADAPPPQRAPFPKRKEESPHQHAGVTERKPGTRAISRSTFSGSGGVVL